MTPPNAPSIAIACGGTGGHLFPGLAVAEQLQRRGCAVTLLISPKEIDQQAVKAALERRSPDRRDASDSKRADLEIGAPIKAATLPAVGLNRGRVFAFARGFTQSYRAAKNLFRSHPPQAVLAMGGFTSAPPVLAGKRFGARTFLHESNVIPGRANRWLSWVVDQAFVGFPHAGKRLHTRQVTVTGTPVRPQFHPRDPAACRVALGLDPGRPTLLVMGGSQGASGINELVIRSLPLLVKSVPQLQLLHLTGSNDADNVRQVCAASGLKAVVHPFFAEMELVLGAATVAISRAGASSMAELAAMRLPSVLVPFPAATDNHQFYNADAFVETNAAHMLRQTYATPDRLLDLVVELMTDEPKRAEMQASLAKWHKPQAAEQIAENILSALARSADGRVREDQHQNAIETRGRGRPRSERRSFAPGWRSALRF